VRAKIVRAKIVRDGGIMPDSTESAPRRARRAPAGTSNGAAGAQSLAEESEETEFSDIAEGATSRRTIRLRIPLLDATIEMPREMVPFYVGLAATAAIDLVDWPLAILVGLGHYIATNSHNHLVKEIAEGVDAGA
jgi:hypothetical protein